MKFLICSAIAVLSWTSIAEAEPKRIAVSEIPAAEMKLATDAVPGFTATAATSDGDCFITGDCEETYVMIGEANKAQVIITVSSNPDGSTVDRIDTQTDIKTVPPAVILAVSKKKKFIPKALFSSRYPDGTQTYLFIGAQGSVPSDLEIRPNGAVVQTTTAKKK